MIEHIMVQDARDVLKVEIYIRKIGVGQEWILLTMINRRYQTIEKILVPN